jgi:hypothetical protein
VRLDVMLGCVLGMFHGMNVVSVCQMRVMGCLLVVAPFMMVRCFMMVARSMLVMLRCLPVMVGCFL